MADDYIVAWSGAKDRAGTCPALSGYLGSSQLSGLMPDAVIWRRRDAAKVQAQVTVQAPQLEWARTLLRKGHSLRVVAKETTIPVHILRDEAAAIRAQVELAEQRAIDQHAKRVLHRLGRS